MILTLDVILLIIALVLLVLAAANVQVRWLSPVHLIAAALALWVLTLLV